MGYFIFCINMCRKDQVGIFNLSLFFLYFHCISFEKCFLCFLKDLVKVISLKFSYTNYCNRRLLINKSCYTNETYFDKN